MDEIIILDGHVVYLVSDSGSDRWEFERLEDAKELYSLLALSMEIEGKIVELCDKGK